MIVAEQKKVNEIVKMLGDDFKQLFILGCGSCVTVCLAGGERETESLAMMLKLFFEAKNKRKSIVTATITRQCDFEFIDEQKQLIEQSDVILSLACGVGVQYLAERFPQKLIFPGLNTSFYGANLEAGKWAERCGGCGECVLDRYGGVCPVARCSKSLLNGPCGGSQDGQCEVDPEIDCGWELIYNRCSDLKRLGDLIAYEPPKNWETARDGGPRRLIKEEYYDD